MAMTPEEKAARARQRLLENVKKKGVAKYLSGVVAPLLQEVIRAEAGADPAPYAYAVVDGEIQKVPRAIGQIVCVTCGKVGPWKGNYFGGGTIEAGHFVAGRAASVVLEETNVHPQSKYCNKQLYGNRAAYTVYMEYMYGQEEIDRLVRLSKTAKQFTPDELVDLRIGYRERLKAAEESMKGE